MHRRAASQRHRNSTGIPFPMGYYAPHGTSPSASASNKTLFLHLITFLRPRKTRLRATFFCLFSLVALTTYVCLISPPVLSPSHPLHPYRAKLDRIDDSWRMFAPTLMDTSNPAHLAVSKPDVKLSPEQELGAITAFMVALPQNALPSNIDPSKQIDPQLVLDFDTRKPQAEMEIDNLVVDVWLGNPVVMFAKLHSAVSRELKSILKEMDINPPPTIFDVDQRDDADVLTPVLFRLTNATELPILLIGGSPVGSMDTIRELNVDGKLKTLIVDAGGVPASGKKRRRARR